MLVENATSPWGESREWILHKHSCIHHSTCACAKPIPEIVLMVKLDIPGIRDNSLQTVGQFDKFNIPVVVSGTCGIPKGHPASLGCGQFDTSTSTPFWSGFLFHTLFVIPFFLEIVLGLLGCFMVKFDFDITIATTLSSFTILYLFVIKKK